MLNILPIPLPNIHMATIGFNLIALTFDLIFVLTNSQIPQQEYEALVDFYHSTNGNDWTINKGWEFVNSTNDIKTNIIFYNGSAIPIVDEPICSNYTPHGLTCLNEMGTTTPWIFNLSSLDTQTFYNIISLEFTSNNLVGTIPDSISSLTYLETLSIRYEQNLTGIVPLSLYDLNYLETFRLEYTSTFIHLSDKLCNWEYLTLFNFSPWEYYNVSKGYIPECIGTKLPYLKKIQLITPSSDSQFRFSMNQTLPLESLFNCSQLVLLNFGSFSFEDSTMYPTLPDTNKLSNMVEFSLSDVHLQGTIPDTICNIGSDVQTKQEKARLGNNNNGINNNTNGMVAFAFESNNLEGTIPSCIFEKMFTVGIDYIEFGLNNLNGSLPSSESMNLFLDNLTQTYYTNNNNNTNSKYTMNWNNECTVYYLILSDNHLSGTIPDWLTKCNYTSMLLLENNEFTGTLPNKFIVNSINFGGNNIEGTIPNDFILDILHLGASFIDLSDNKLTGSVSSIFISNFDNEDEIVAIYFQNNKLESFPFGKMEYFHNLTSLVLSNNKIYHQHSGKIINRLLTWNNNLQHLILHQNKITGDINTWNTSADNLKVLTLHENDISGKLDADMSTKLIPNIEYLTLFENRLSCQLPIQMSNYSTNNNDNGSQSIHFAMAILGNFFTMSYSDAKKIKHNENNNDFPWELIKASNLYLFETELLVNESYMIISFACLVFLMFVILGLLLWIQCQDYQLDSYHPLVHKHHLQLPEMFKSASNNYRLYSCLWFAFLIINVGLCLLYYSGADYYECGSTTSHYSLIYFNSNNLILQNSVALMFVLMQIVYLALLFIIKININAKKSENCGKNSSKNGKNGKKLGRRATEVFSKQYDRCSCCCCVWNVIYTGIYVLIMIVTVGYVICQTLPNDNIFGFSIEDDLFIHYGLAVVLTLTNSYIVPRIVDSCLCNGKVLANGDFSEEEKEKEEKRVVEKNRLFLTILRSILSFFLPLIVSVLFLNDCFKFWTYFWNDCIDDKNSFDITYDAEYSNIGQGSTLFIETDTFELSTHGDVCNTRTIGNININSCLREFLDIWIPIIAAKLCLSIINPWIMLFIKYYHLDEWMYCMCCRNGNSSDSGSNNNNSSGNGNKSCKNNKKKNGRGHNYSFYKASLSTNKTDGNDVQLALLDHENSDILVSSDNYNDDDDDNDDDDYERKVESKCDSSDVVAASSKERDFISRRDDCDSIRIIDARYSLIITKFDLCIVFGLFSPFLLFIAQVGILSNYYCYYGIMEKKLGWKIIYNVHKHIPIGLLFISVLIQQVTILVFCWTLFVSAFTNVYLIAVFVACDVVFLFKFKFET